MLLLLGLVVTAMGPQLNSSRATRNRSHAACQSQQQKQQCSHPQAAALPAAVSRAAACRWRTNSSQHLRLTPTACSSHGTLPSAYPAVRKPKGSASLRVPQTPLNHNHHRQLTTRQCRRTCSNSRPSQHLAAAAAAPCWQQLRQLSSSSAAAAAVHPAAHQTCTRGEGERAGQTPAVSLLLLLLLVGAATAATAACSFPSAQLVAAAASNDRLSYRQILEVCAAAAAVTAVLQLLAVLLAVRTVGALPTRTTLPVQQALTRNQGRRQQHPQRQGAQKQQEQHQLQAPVAVARSGCSCVWTGLTAAAGCGRAAAATALAAWVRSMVHRQQPLLELL